MSALGEPFALLLLRRQNVRRALVAREQVRAVFGFQERVERFDARDDADEIVVAEREDRVDEIVALALVAELDLEAIGEEGEEVARRSVSKLLAGRSGRLVNRLAPQCRHASCS